MLVVWGLLLVSQLLLLHFLGCCSFWPPKSCSSLLSLLLTFDLVVGMDRQVVGGSEPWMFVVETTSFPTKI
jgi:hypothetical protein